MSRGVNKVIIVGNAGNDAEVRFMPSGGAVANVSLATSESWKDKQTGETQERTEWHRVSFMDRGNFRLGQIAGDFIKKGSKVYVEGSLRTREWEKDGIKRYTTEIIASELQLLDGKPDSQQAPQQAPASGFNQAPAQPKPQPQSFGSNPDGGFATPAPTQQAPAADLWANAVPAGEPAQKGASIEQIKGHDQVNGDFSKALALGWVTDGSIPF